MLLAAGSVAANDEDAKLSAFFRRFFEEQLKHSPSMATRLGDHRYDHVLDDLSPEARAAADDRLRKALANLPKEVDYQKLSRSRQIDFEILTTDLKRSLGSWSNSSGIITKTVLASIGFASR